MSDDHATDQTHLAVDEAAAYVDRTLPAAARERVERHLVRCAECRAEIVALRRLAKPRSRVWTVAVPLAAAAVLLLAVLPFSEFRRPEDKVGPMVRGSTDRTAAIEALRPLPGATLGADSISFVWHAIAPETSYRVTVTNDRGDVIWSASVSDTIAVLPHAVRLEHDRHYTWFVDALLSDGRSVTSGVRDFTTAR